MTGQGGDHPSTELRAAALLLDLVALWALAATSLLDAAGCAALGVLVVAASLAPLTLTSPAWQATRRAVAVGLLLLAATLVAFQVAAGGQGLLGAGPALALLVGGLMTGHALLLDTRRDLLVAVAVAVAAVVLAAGYAPGSAVAPPLVASWVLALGALALAQRDARLASVQGTVGGDGRPARSWSRWVPRAAVPAVGLAVVTGLVVYLLVPQPSGLAVRSRLLGGGLGAGGLPNDETAATSRTPGYLQQLPLDLRLRGSLPDDPVLDVPSDSPVLWRGSVLATYDGATWTPPTLDRAGLLPGGPTYEVPTPLDPVPVDATRAGVRRVDRVEVRARSYDGLVVAPGPVSSVTSSDGRALIDGSGAVRVVGGDGRSVSSYTVGSTIPVTDPAVLSAASGQDQADPAWLQLPASLPARVADLGTRLTAGRPTRHAQVRAVEDYLRANETYRLDSPVPTPGADAVDDFLFVSHTGFCEQFASAEVVLLRAAGVPARLVTGFAYGEPDSGQRLYRASDAHAWVEVWYPGIGWSTSDPTAGSALAAASGPSLLDRLTRLLTAPASQRALTAVAVAAGALVVGLLGGGVVTLARRRRRRGGPDGGGGRAGDRPRPGPVLAAYGRLAAALDRVGRPRAPAESLEELGRRLPDLDGRGSTRTALRTLERECYAATPPGTDEAEAAVRALDRLAGRVLEQARR